VITRLVRSAAASALMLSSMISPIAAAGPSPPPPTKTPIQHAVFLMGESRSFDSLFGTYPGADGIPADVCMPNDPATAGGGCVAPLWVGDRTVPKFAQTGAVFAAQYDQGKMDGFVHAQAEAGSDAPLVMGHYDERDIPFSWNVADAYVLFDRFFSSTTGSSLQNHLYWVSGTAGPDPVAIPSDGFGDLQTIFDRLEAAGIEWKFYVQNYDRTVTFRNSQAMIDRPAQVERVPLLAFARFVDDPRFSRHIVDLSEYYRDIDQGALPAVSYIVPAGGGASTQTSIRTSERLGLSIINALTRSSAWGSSMLLWTYDGWGGWYDHVVPPQVDASGYGFRVPAMLVSPFARQGYVDDTPLDFTSMIRFITTNWGLQPLASRDTSAQTFMDAFDFANPGRAPVFLAATRDVNASRAEPKRLIIFLAYGIALVAAIALIGIAAMRTRRPRRRDHAQKAGR
jgi:phospholipase C